MPINKPNKTTRYKKKIIITRLKKMNWKAHILVGSIIGTLTALILLKTFNQEMNFSKWIFLLTIILLSPLICDLDHNNGKLKKLLSIIFSLTLITGIILSYLIGQNQINQLITISAIGLATISLLPVFFRHRGFMHSITFVMIYSLTIGLLSFSIINGLIAGITAWSHLWLDKIPFKIK